MNYFGTYFLSMYDLFFDNLIIIFLLRVKFHDSSFPGASYDMMIIINF